eukprot:2963034-Heterocapsa_arctica.AAC.1
MRQAPGGKKPHQRRKSEAGPGLKEKAVRKASGSQEGRPLRSPRLASPRLRDGRTYLVPRGRVMRQMRAIRR